MVAIEADVDDQYLDELRHELPRLSLTVTPGRLVMSGQRRCYRRRISGSSQDLRVVADCLTFAGHHWTRVINVD